MTQVVDQCSADGYEGFLLHERCDLHADELRSGAMATSPCTEHSDGMTAWKLAAL